MKNKFALVTGASSGIGFQYARVLARRGYDLVIVSNEDAINDRAHELQQEFPEVNVVALVRDLSREESAKELFEYCNVQGLDVEMLVNNAGVYHDRDFCNDSEGFNSLILKLHMYTPAMLCYFFGKQMAEKGKGYIINMGSVTHTMAAQRLATYGASKSFLHHFSQSLHIELKAKGVRVTTVSPGAVDTGLYNLNSTATRIGKALGFIVSPEYLAKRGVRAVLHGRNRVTVPFVWTIIAGLVWCIPTCVLQLIRRLGWF